MLVLEMFTKCAGLKMNKEKSEAMWIGASSNYRHKPYGLKWNNSLVKSLGIYIGTDPIKMINENFNERLKKIENLIDMWCLRKLTLKGKVIIVNTLLLPQLLYVCTVLHTPQWVITKYNNMISKFIWNTKPPKVKNTSLINNIENGGLKLQDLELKIQAIKLKWVKKLMEEQNTPWKSYLAQYIMDEINMLPYYNINEHDMPRLGQPFYDGMFNMWTKLHFNKPTDTIPICEQIIWNNSHIKIDNKLVYYKHWQMKNIYFIQQLLDDTGNIAKKNFLENKYSIVCKHFEYESLIHAIPKEWKKIVIEDNISTNITIHLKCKIKMDKEEKDITEIATKDLYWHLVNDKSERPTSENKWYEKSDLDLTQEEWKIVYKMPYQLTRETKLITFHYKIVHRIIACNYQLHIWKVSDSNMCDFCNEIDTIEHFFVQCPLSKQFWCTFSQWWANFSLTYFPVYIYETLFGIPNEENNILINNLNYLLLHANYYIYVTKKRKERLDMYKYLVECKNKLRTEYELMLSKDKEDKFQQKWGELYDYIS